MTNYNGNLLHIEASGLLLKIKSNSLLKKNKIYYIICHTGQRSYLVTEQLHNQGYHIINVLGGIAQMPEYYHY